MIEIQHVAILPDFDIGEFDCPCCGKNKMNRVFLWKLQQCRTEAKIPFIITSGYRCKKHNKVVGGKINSEHLTGEAADIVAANSFDRFKIIDAALKTGFRRIGIGEDFIHLGSSLYLPQQVIWVY